MIDQKGQLRLPMDRLNMFFAHHKEKRVTIRIEVLEPGTSAALFGYYYNYVVPTITQAFKEAGQRMSDDYTDRFLIQEFPGDFGLQPGAYVNYARQLNQAQMLDFLEWVKQYAAENLFVYIDDPRTI